MDRATIELTAKSYVHVLAEDRDVRRVHSQLTDDPALVGLINATVGATLSTADLPALREYITNTTDPDTRRFEDYIQGLAPEDYCTSGNGGHGGGGGGHDGGGNGGGGDGGEGGHDGNGGGDEHGGGH